MPVTPTTPVAEILEKGSILCISNRWAVCHGVTPWGDISFRFEDDRSNQVGYQLSEELPFAEKYYGR